MRLPSMLQPSRHEDEADDVDEENDGLVAAKKKKDRDVYGWF